MDYQERIKSLQAILRQNPNDAKIRKALALLLSENGFTQEALAHLIHITNSAAADSSVYYNIGILYEKLENIDNAQKAYEKAVEISPKNIDAYYNLGLIYTQKGLYDYALNCFLNVLNADENDENTWFSAGLCYFKSGNLIKAKEYFEKAVVLNNEDIYAHFYLGNIFIKTEDFDNAKK